jgi:xanthine dehydrogenase molybdopterin-binding subunit B
MQDIENCACPTQLPGVVAFVGADDIPAGGNKLVFGDALFAGDRVDYVGQRLGLIVATSQVGCANPSRTS